MDRNEIKDFIVEKTLEGMPMTAIQDALADAGVKIRFMELRLLAAECDAVLEKKRQEKAAAEAKAAAAANADAPAPAPAPVPAPAAPGPANSPDAPAPAPAPAPEENAKPRGATTVTVSPIQRPGYLACGMVTFGSGSTAEWFLDQSGQLALDNVKGADPDRQDQQEFVAELRKVLGGARG